MKHETENIGEKNSQGSHSSSGSASKDSTSPVDPSPNQDNPPTSTVTKPKPSFFIKKLKAFKVSPSWIKGAAWLIGTLISLYGLYLTYSQYLLSNKPRLQLANVGFDERNFSTQPAVLFQLENLGNHPTEVSRSDLGWGVATDRDPKPWESLAHKKTVNTMPFAVSKERPVPQKIILHEADSTIAYIIKNVANPFYIFGDYYYHDEVADEKMVYRMVVEVRRDGSFRWEINKNEPAP